MDKYGRTPEEAARDALLLMIGIQEKNGFLDSQIASDARSFVATLSAAHTAPSDEVKAAASRLLNDCEKAGLLGFDYDAKDMADIALVARAALSGQAGGGEVERLREALEQIVNGPCLSDCDTHSGAPCSCWQDVASTALAAPAEVVEGQGS